MSERTWLTEKQAARDKDAHERIPFHEIVPGEIYRPDQVAATMYVKPEFVTDAIRDKKLKARFLGPRTIRIKGEWIIEWAESIMSLEDLGPQPEHSPMDNGASFGGKAISAGDIALRSV